VTNNCTIIIDESVDYAIVDLLRANGFTVYAIIDETPSISDNKVLNISNEQNALLITEDKDFGELVFRFQLPHKGILLVRMIDAKSTEKAEAVLKVLREYYNEMIENFSVLDKNKLRIRK
jgi:predicted nuclease of predicted toxin-antitoxin system